MVEQDVHGACHVAVVQQRLALRGKVDLQHVDTLRSHVTVVPNHLNTTQPRAPCTTYTPNDVATRGGAGETTQLAARS